MGQQQRETRRRRGALGRVHIGPLRIVALQLCGSSIPRRASTAPCRSTTLATILHEHLARIATALDDLALAGVTVVVAQHRHHAERRRELAERAP